MTLEQLRIFLAVAERLHVTQAAAAVNLSQSAVSAALRALEGRLGVALFDRVGRGVVLTEAGRALVPEAKAVLLRADQAAQALADLAGLRRGRLAIWASHTIAGYWLPAHLHRFHARHPGVSLSLTIGNTAQVARAARDGDADLGLVEGDVDDPLLARARVGEDQLTLVTAGGSAPPPQTPAELLGRRWVLREAGSGTRAMFEAALRGWGLDPARLDVALTLPSNEAVRAAVIAGAGMTALSRLVVADSLASGALVAGGLALPTRAFTALRHGDHRRSHAEAAFMALLRAGDQPVLA